MNTYLSPTAFTVLGALFWLGFISFLIGVIVKKDWVKWFISSLLFHLVCGIFVNLYYSYVDPSTDLHQMFTDINKVYAVAPSIFFSFLFGEYSECISLISTLGNHNPRYLFMLRCISIFYPFSFGSKWGLSLIFSTLSAWGGLGVAFYFKERFRSSWMQVGLSFMMYPSVVFWSSSFHKESLLLLFIGGWMWGLLRKSLIKRFVLISFFAWGMYTLKFHYAALVIPLSLYGEGLRFFHVEKKYSIKSLALGSICFAMIGIYLFSFHPHLDVFNVIPSILGNNEHVKSISNPKAILWFPEMEGVWKFLLYIPLGIFYGLFSPIWGFSFFSTLAAIENIALLVLSFPGFYFFVRYRLLNIKESSIAYWLVLIFVFSASGLIAIAAPNVGALVRYRVGYLPVWIWILFEGYRRYYNTRKVRRKTSKNILLSIDEN